MAPTLGKRKRITREELEQPSRSPSPSSNSQDSDGEDLQAIFRRAFEAKFKPLEVEPVKPRVQEIQLEDEESEEESDWSGISSEDEEQVEVFDYATTQQASDKASKAEMRAFMSSKPPTSTSTSALSKPLPKPTKDPSDPTEASHLKNDLELQSLLRESHLLSSHAPTFSTRAASARDTANARHKLTDLHIQSLGAKTSVFTQKNMPMAHRKGIAAKAKNRDEKRRAEARENGIVLEREKKVRKVVGRRERGVGGPSVGRFKGGTLTLSRKDVASITGGGGKRGGKGKKARR